MRPIFRVVLHKRGLFWLIEILFSIIKHNSHEICYIFYKNLMVLIVFSQISGELQRMALEDGFYCTIGFRVGIKK
jgi:hypothetical protein